MNLEYAIETARAYAKKNNCPVFVSKRSSGLVVTVGAHDASRTLGQHVVTFYPEPVCKT